VAGWTGRPDFAADAFDALYEVSGGVPRRLNVLAGRVLLQAAVEGVELIGEETVKSVAADMAADMGAIGSRPRATPIQPEPAPIASPQAAAPTFDRSVFGLGTLGAATLNGAPAPAAMADPIVRTRIMPDSQTGQGGSPRIVAPPPAPEPVSLRPIPEPRPAPEPQPAKPARRPPPIRRRSRPWRSGSRGWRRGWSSRRRRCAAY
jgi:hypothetical protein